MAEVVIWNKTLNLKVNTNWGNNIYNFYGNFFL